MISARALRLDLGQGSASDELDFDVARGECLALVEPRGDASEALRAIAAQRPILSGTLTVAGTDVRLRPFDVWSKVALADNSLVSGAGLRVDELLRLVGQRHGNRTGTDQGLVSMLPMPHEAMVSTLDRASRTLVAIAAAVGSGADVLLLDEPLDGLDDNACDLVLRCLAECLRQQRTLVTACRDASRLTLLRPRILPLRTTEAQTCAN